MFHDDLCKMMLCKALSSLLGRKIQSVISNQVMTRVSRVRDYRGKDGGR